MNNFKDYATIYDSFYVNKNYELETKNVIKLCKIYGNPLESILEIGSGTGTYSSEFAKNGIKVIGIDKSKSMVEVSKKRNKYPEMVDFIPISMSDYARNNLKYTTYDAVCSLFHVVTYFSDSEVLDFVYVCNESLKSGGLVVFDFWERNAVKENPPSASTKISQVNGNKIVRKAKPSFNEALNKIEVIFNFESNGATLFFESHVMFPRTVEEWISAFGPNFEYCGAFDIDSQEKFSKKFYGCLIVLRKL